jgi:Putative diphthamide synthesis protein
MCDAEQVFTFRFLFFIYSEDFSYFCMLKEWQFEYDCFFWQVLHCICIVPFVYVKIFMLLGRQGSPKVLGTLENKLKAAGKAYIIVLLSEVFPSKLQLFPDVEA